tara:strand:- start:673 stop:2022 length:1350 start_codon:yes stop_codon:yes gene_type:complete
MHEFMHLSFLTATPSPALYYMVVTLLVLGAVSLQAPNTIPNVTVHPNASFGGAIWSSHETNWYIKYLANVTSFEACLEACRAWDAQPGAKCKAAQWYYPNSTEPRSQGCYARIDGLNQTTPQQDVISAQLAWPCVTDEDCNLNGVCGANGTCACDPQWDGADCGALRLLPAPKDGGTATWFATRNGSSQWVSGGPVPKQLRPLRSPPPAVAWALSSQGGNPFRSFDGRYHVFVVEMTKSCAIVDYTTNSRIVQASSASPLGPYEFDTVWRAPFAHTPRAWPGPNGSLLVAYVGRQAVPDAAQRDCRGEGGARAEARGGAVADVEEKAGTGQDFSYRNPECVGIMVAQSASGNLSGPWTHNFVYDPSIDEWYGAPGLTGQQGGAPGGINNPSLLVLPNGTALLAGRTCTLLAAPEVPVPSPTRACGARQARGRNTSLLQRLRAGRARTEA